MPITLLVGENSGHWKLKKNCVNFFNSAIQTRRPTLLTELVSINPLVIITIDYMIPDENISGHESHKYDNQYTYNKQTTIKATNP